MSVDVDAKLVPVPGTTETAKGHGGGLRWAGLVRKWFPKWLQNGPEKRPQMPPKLLPNGVPGESRSAPEAPGVLEAVPKRILKKIARVRGRFWADLGANLRAFGRPPAAILGFFGGQIFDAIFGALPKPVWDPFWVPK